MSEEDASNKDQPRLHKMVIDGLDVYVLSQPQNRKLPDILSVAEKEVVELVLAGLGNSEIAQKRETALQTVANQIYSIFKKLEVNSRAELSALIEEISKGY